VLSTERLIDARVQNESRIIVHVSICEIESTANMNLSETSNTTEDTLTEEERKQYEKGIVTWSKVIHWRFWVRKEWLWYYIAGILIVILVALMAFFHKDVSGIFHTAETADADRQIVHWLTPFTQRMRNIKVGWLIFIAIIFALSFPPLFGNGTRMLYFR
jgi:hypothetical protein